MLGAVGVLMVVGVVAAVMDRTNLAVAVVVLLLGVAVGLLLDQRGRIGDVAHMQRLAAQRHGASHADVVRRVRRLATRTELRRAGRDIAALRRRARAVGRRVDGLADTWASVDPAIVRRALEPGGQLDQMERRFLASFEAERLRSADRHREGLDATLSAVAEFDAALEALRKKLTRDLERAFSGSEVELDKKITKRLRDEVRQVEALLQIYPRIEPRVLMPPSGHWAMDARCLAHLSDIVRAHAPRTVLELGGGTSTVWLGYLLEGSGARVVSIDHETRFADQTRDSVKRHELAATVEVRHAPLVEIEGGAEWYDPTVFADVDGIDLLVVDGPPASIADLARYPALPLLAPRLADGAVVILDDADRDKEAAIVRQWCEQFGLRRVDENVSRLAVLVSR